MKRSGARWDKEIAQNLFKRGRIRGVRRYKYFNSTDMKYEYVFEDVLGHEKAEHEYGFTDKGIQELKQLAEVAKWDILKYEHNPYEYMSDYRSVPFEDYSHSVTTTNPYLVGYLVIAGLDITGISQLEYDYDEYGRDTYGYNEDGLNKAGYDADGFDENGDKIFYFEDDEPLNYTQSIYEFDNSDEAIEALQFLLSKKEHLDDGWLTTIVDLENLIDKYVHNVEDVSA